jgi:hypothetical protein
VILDSQDIGQAQRATSAILGTVLAEHGTTFDRWVVLDALATGAVPPERARFVPRLSAALATGPAAVEAVIGRAQHATLRSEIDHMAGELYAGISEHDLAAAHRVLTELTRRADGWMRLWGVTRPAEPAR